MEKDFISESPVKFVINGTMCCCNGVEVWTIDEKGKKESMGSFEDIKLLEKTSHCAIFYSECLNEYLSFDGKDFNNINNIYFKIIPRHHEDDLPQMPEMWEQVRVFIDDVDIINNIGSDNDFHWGIESSCFLAQKNDYYKGKLLIGICSCTVEGDDDIIVDVDKSDNYVSWKIYHDRNHDLNGIFIFNKNNYQNVLDDAKINITKNEEDVYK